MSKKDIKAAQQEAKVLEVLNHPNIIRFIEVYSLPKKKKLCIVMDFADGGDLNSELKERLAQTDEHGTPNYLTENELLNWFT
jgi:NIMA (never in mitosis gene a)-related kinase